VGNPEEMRPLENLDKGWVDNITIDLREIELGGINWINLTQDRDQSPVLVNMVTNNRIP
jgi:hypothetical protein